MQQTAQIKPTYQELETKVAFLEFELDKLRRLIFGQKRERFVPVANPGQLDIQLDDPRAETAPAKVENISYTRTKTATKTPHGRNFLPPHLPRKDIIIEPDQDISELKKIGDEITD